MSRKSSSDCDIDKVLECTESRKMKFFETLECALFDADIVASEILGGEEGEFTDTTSEAIVALFTIGSKIAGVGANAEFSGVDLPSEFEDNFEKSAILAEIMDNSLKRERISDFDMERISDIIDGYVEDRKAINDIRKDFIVSCLIGEVEPGPPVFISRVSE